MCGRYALSSDVQDMVMQFDLKGNPKEFLPANWNIAPTTNVYFISASDNAGQIRQLEIGSWGLVPIWSKDTSRAASAINARLESVSEKPSFRSAFKSHRCLVPANGYYEWATELGDFKLKQPFFISNLDKSLLAMAGLYETWVNPQTGKELISLSIITRESTGQIAKIHHRMPVILPKDRWATWLSATPLAKKQVSEYLDLLELPEPDSGLQAWPVSTEVNNTKNHGSELIEKIDLTHPNTLF